MKNDLNKDGKANKDRAGSVDSVLAVILAGGRDEGMRSELPKVLHRVGGLPMAALTLQAVRQAGVQNCVLAVGFGADQVRRYFQDTVAYAEPEQNAERDSERTQPCGTGDAVRYALDAAGDFSGKVLVIYGDLPLIRPETIAGLLEANHARAEAASAVVTANAAKAYAGIFCFEAEALRAAFHAAREGLRFVAPQDPQFGGPQDEASAPDNALTLAEVLARIQSAGGKVGSVPLQNVNEAFRPADRVQLAEACRIARAQKCESLMRDAGVTIIDPQQTYIDRDVTVGQDTVIYPGCILEGGTSIGRGAVIGPYTRITDSTVGNFVKIEQSVLTQSAVADGVNIGPFAYLRPGSALGENVKIGDFVEIKNSTVGRGTKIPHLSYVGDADVGENTNIGCGVITCNYDGKQKHRTTIGDNVFVGSNSNLVAPVRLMENSYVASGSTITDTVPEDALAIARARQVVKEQWVSKKGLTRSKS